MTRGERHSSGHVEWRPLGNDRTIATAPHLGRSWIVPRPVAMVAQACRELRTIDEHAARIAAAPALLADLVNRGLLLPEETLVGPRPAGERPELPAISTIGIVTRDRPHTLQRCLDRLGDALARTGRRPRIVVADDSTDPVAHDHNRAALDAVGKRCGLATRLIGAGDKARLAARLCAHTGIDPAIVDLALRGRSELGVTTGANRNVLLAVTGGELALQVDDDVVWRLAAMLDPTGGIRVVPAGADPTAFHFFPDRAAALAATPELEVDGVGLHESLLGGRLADCVAAAGDPDRPLIAGPIDPALVRHMAQGEGRVIATSFGVAGDCAMWSPATHLLLSGRSRANLLADHATAIRTREVVRAAPQTTLARGGFFMCTAVGLDNRDLLPPMFPVARNQDGIFGVMVAMCVDDGYFAHLPWVIAHEPAEARAFDPDAVWSTAAAVRLSNLVIAALSTTRPMPPAMPVAARMESIGAQLEELGGLAVDDFAEAIRNQLWRGFDAYLHMLEATAKQIGDSAPAYQDDARRQRDAVLSRVVSPDFLIPVDLPVPVEQRLAAAQAAIAGFGRIVSRWPALRAAISSLGDI